MTRPAANSHACPDDRRLAALVRGIVSAQEEAELGEHIDGCESCQQRLEAVAVSPEFAEHVGQQLGSADAPTSDNLSDAIKNLPTLGAVGNTQHEHPGISLDIAAFFQPTDRPSGIGTLGGYEILEELGRGGMGVVFRAHDSTLDRVVALKVLAPHLACDPTCRRRFVNEAKAAAAVNHRNVVTIFGVNESASLPFLVMEYVRGRTLQQQLDADGPLPIQNVVAYGVSIASGLAAAHKKKLIHRDIKPANLLLDEDSGELKITDFGLARAAADERLTRSGVVAGTPAYMAPEQANELAFDHRADLFSLGSVIYAMCTGRPPFEGDTMMSIVRSVTEETPEAITEARPETPDWLANIVTRLHAKQPADRIETADEVVQCLRRQLVQSVQQSTNRTPSGSNDLLPDSDPPFPTKFGWIGGGFGLAAVLILAAITLFWPDVKPPSGDQAAQAVSGDTASRSVDQQSTSDAKAGTQAFASPTDASQRVVAMRAKQDVQSYDSLREAILACPPGCILQLRSNGPYRLEPVVVSGRKLHMEAAPGMHPVVVRQASPIPRAVPMISTDSPIILEGIEFQDRRSSSQEVLGFSASLLRIRMAPAVIANCRFIVDTTRAAAEFEDASPVVMRNCEVHCTTRTGIVWRQTDYAPALPPESAMTLDNCLLTGRIGINVMCMPQITQQPARYLNKPPQMQVELRRCSILTSFAVMIGPASLEYSESNKEARVAVSAESSLLHSRSTILLPAPELRPDQIPSKQATRPEWIDSTLTWTDNNNLFVASDNFIALQLPKNKATRRPNWSPKSIPDWNAFWFQLPTGSVEVFDNIVFQGGPEILGLSMSVPESLQPQMFATKQQALPPVWKHNFPPGIVSRITGPGVGYNRWRPTDEYRDWSRKRALLIRREAQNAPQQP